MMQRNVFAILLTVLMTILLGACRQESPTQDTATTTTAAVETDTASATHPASPGGTALVPDVAAGTTVLVVLEDNSLALPGQPIPPGPAVLTVENRGNQVHNLYIEGEGINRAPDQTIDAGKSATVDVVFQAGTYTFYCPILNHRENGEEVTMTIAAP